MSYEWDWGLRVHIAYGPSTPHQALAPEAGYWNTTISILQGVLIHTYSCPQEHSTHHFCPLRPRANLPTSLKSFLVSQRNSPPSTSEIYLFPFYESSLLCILFVYISLYIHPEISLTCTSV